MLLDVLRLMLGWILWGGLAIAVVLAGRDLVPLLMSTARLALPKQDPKVYCSACTQKATIRCPRCATRGIIVPYCSQEHQEMMWSTHWHICRRVQNTPFIPQLSEGEHMYWILSTRKRRAFYEKALLRDFIAKGGRRSGWRNDGQGLPNLLEFTTEIRMNLRWDPQTRGYPLPLVCHEKLKSLWYIYEKSRSPAASLAAARAHNRTTPIDPRYSTNPPPDFGPSYMPYHLLGPSLVSLIECQVPWHAPGLVDLVNSLVIYFTVYVHHGLAGVGDKSKVKVSSARRAQLRELWRRVQEEERRLQVLCEPDWRQESLLKGSRSWEEYFKPVTSCVEQAAVFQEELEALWGRQWF